MPEITKSYEPREIEQKWRAAWQAADGFAGRVVEGRQPYSIVIPPPNVTGVLTIGHVLNNTLQDILIRRARLEGQAALWLPGTDHAGIATQTVVERELRKLKLRRRDLIDALGRDDVRQGLGLGLAQLVGLCFAAAFGHGLGEVGEDHREPEPGADAPK